MFCGSWVLTGLLVFIIAEKIFSVPTPENEVEETSNTNTEVLNRDSLNENKVQKKEDIMLNNNTCDFSNNSFHQINSDHESISSAVTSTKASSKQVILIQTLV